MSRVLAYTTPARGHLYPIVPTLLELRRRGYSVAVRTLSTEVDRLRDMGFDARPIAPAIEAIELDDYRSRTPLGRQRRAVDVFMRRAPLDAADLGGAIAEEGPEALLVDLNAWGAMTAAEATGLPWATWMPYLLPLPSAGAPP